MKKTMRRYKLQKTWKIDRPMISKKLALLEAEVNWEQGGKNLIKLEIIEKENGIETIIKTFKRREKKKTKPETEK